MAQFVEEFSVLQKILTEVQSLGYSVTSVEQLTPEVVGAWAASHGFSEVVTDAGTHAAWVQGSNLAEIAAATASEASTATTTGTAWTLGSTAATVAEADVLVGDVVNATGELVSENVATTALTNVEMSGLGLAATETGAGATAAAVTLTPKTVVICGAAAALGLTIGFDTGQAIVAEMEGNDFDWEHDSVGGKIITYLTSDGRTYLKQDLIDKLKKYFIEKGMYGSGGPEGEVVTTTTVQVSYMDVETFGGYLLSQLQRPSNFPAGDFTNMLVRAIDNWNDILTYNGDNQGDMSNSKITKFTAEAVWTSSYKEIRLYATFNNTDYVNSGSFNQQSGGSVTCTTTAEAGRAGTVNRIFKSRYSYPYTQTDGQGCSSGQITLQVSNPAPGTSTAEISRIDGLNIGHMTTPVPGVNKKPGATYPATNVPVSTTYPTWASQRKYVDNPDDIIQDRTKPRTPILPVQLPFSDPEDVSQPDSQNNPNPDPNPNTKPMEDLKPQPDPDTKIPTDDQGQNDDPDPTTGGGGSGTMGTGMVHIYNPTLAQLAAFSEYLWSGLFDLDSFKKLFQDPMQAIIGLHLLYATPTRDTNDHNIIVGNQNTGKMSRIVTNQYINIDFGKVVINKYFNNVCDYIDTELELFLPFVGFTQLSAKELVGKKVGLKGTIDVLTGTILYKVFNGDQVLYAYAGQCSVQLPLSGVNYSSTIASITGLIGAAGIGIATVASGGTLTPVMAAGGAAAAANTATHMSHQVQRSGGIGGNAGAMGPRTPYIIVTRHKPYNPSQFNEYYGYPSNIKATLTKCTGYTRVKDVRLHGITATSAELSEIEALLKGGIII